MTKLPGSVGDGSFKPFVDDGKSRVNGRVVRVWSGEVEHVCPVCAHTHSVCDWQRERVSMIDGATVWGPWSLMCERAFRRFGVGLGTGRGQRYERKRLDDGSMAWVKVAG